MFIPHATWKRHQEACRYRAINVVNSPIIIPDLNVELVKIFDMNNVNLTLYDACSYMEPTVLFLFQFDQCVEHIFYELDQYMHDVSKKFEYFVSFLRQNCITNKSDANTLYKIYDKNFIIECELIVYDLDYIVYTALHDK